MKQNPRPTLDEVRNEMARLQVVGWSSMSSFTPSELMEHLAHIEGILERRKIVAQER